MDDLISRTSVINLVHGYFCKKIDEVEENTESEDRPIGLIEPMLADNKAICKEIKKLTSVEALTWIPCSERLPEEDEKVIISTKTDRVYVGVYTKRYGFSMREGFICDDGFMWMNTAIAWMQMPQPYKEK